MANPQPDGNTAFFYGTLMATPILYRVLYGTVAPQLWQKSSLRIRPALLPGFCRYRIQCVDYPGIVPEIGKMVRGTFVEGLTQGDVWRLDVFEGAEYARVKVKVRILDGQGAETDEELETESYVFIDGNDRLEEKEWNFQHFVKEKLSRWTNDSKEYIEADGMDPSGGRHWKDSFGTSGGAEAKSEVISAALI